MYVIGVQISIKLFKINNKRIKISVVTQIIGYLKKKRFFIIQLNNKFMVTWVCKF